jgi:hypothetical protein
MGKLHSTCTPPHLAARQLRAELGHHRGRVVHQALEHRAAVGPRQGVAVHKLTHLESKFRNQEISHFRFKGLKP